MKKIMKKRWISLILCMALIFPFVGNLATVQAAQMTKSYDLSTYRQLSGETITRDYPKDVEGYVFAGWYTDDTCSTPVGVDETTGTAVAKFVDANVLSVKFQMTADTTTGSAQTDLRMVTTVDNFKYQSVGFKISTSKATITPTTRTVYESLKGYTNGEGRVYRPSFFSEDSNYFMAYTLKGIKNASFNETITVTPQWTTLDGTVVDGITRSMSINTYADKSGVIISGDSTGNIKGYEWCKPTTEDEPHKVGSGAFISAGASTDVRRFIVALKNAVDISAYKDGALQFWLYMGNDVAFTSTTMKIELTSAGKADNSELYWEYPVAQLERNSWNLVKLTFADATKNNGSTGEFDYTAVNYLRLYFDKTESSESVKMILDDVRAVEADAPGVIFDCDTTTNLSSKDANVSQTTVENGYQEDATGAFKSTGTAQVRYRMVLKRAVDINAYKDGALQFWLYVGDITKTTDYDVFGGYQNFAVELSSSGTDTANKIRWSTSFSALNIKANSWNKITLNFADAAKTGEMDYSKVNFFRLFMGGTTTADALMIVDDIRAVETVKDTTTDSTGLILSCDSFHSGDRAGFALTSVSGEYKTGTGAYKSQNNGQQRFVARLKTSSVDASVNIDEFKDGALQFWLYVGEKSKFNSTTFQVELSSGANADTNEIYWDYKFADIKENSWNLMTLKFADGSAKGGKIDYTKVNWFRIYVSASSGIDSSACMILDDVRAVKIAEPGVLMSCDNEASMSLVGNTNVVETSDIKEGTGAFKATGSGNVLWKAVLDKPVNISAFKDGGIHAWLRVEDVSKLAGDIHVELSSDGSTSGYRNTHEYEWTVSKDMFANGTWTEVYLPFTQAIARDGGANLTAVNWLRVYVPSGVNDTVTVMLDDVRAKVSTKQDILDCDDLNGVTLQYAELTNDADQCQGGQGGAFITKNASQIRVQATLQNRVDISDFKNGKLHLWLYIEDVDKWAGNVGIEISSNGHPDKNALEWQLNPKNAADGLKNGWNEIYLDIASGDAKNGGQIDYELLNLIRIYQSSNKDLQAFTTILDDVYVVRSTQILACDSASEIVSSSVTVKDTSVEADKMYVQKGKGAFYYSGTNQVIWGSKLTNSIDISDCSDGGIQFWFYIDNKDNINGTLNIELTSGGANDKYELQWNIDKSELQNGWNQITKRFADATTRGGHIDYSAINYIRIFHGSENATANIVTCIDDICAVGYK